MSKLPRNLFQSVLFLLFALTLAACGGSGSSADFSVAVSGVSLNKAETEIWVGGTEQLTATVAPDDASNKGLTWSSSDTGIATVDATGLVTAVAAGSATITVSTADGGKTASATVTVTVKKTLADVVSAGTVPADLATAYDADTQLMLKPYPVGTAVVAKYFTESGAGTKDGSSWANAYVGNGASGLIKQLTDLTAPVDTDKKVYLFLVKAGTYKAGSQMAMKNNVALIGGWSGTGFTRSGSTVFSGETKYRVFSNSGTTIAPMTNRALLFGARVQDGGSCANGLGMLNSGSSPSITQVMFVENISPSQGQGCLYVYGGGMSNEASSAPILTQVTFSGNSTGRGGGMSNDSSSPVLNQVTFSDNSAGSGGGGMYNYFSSSPVLNRVTFSGNSAGSGGGMYNDNDGGSGPTIVNSVFWGNTATTSGAQIYLLNDGSTEEMLTLINSIVQGGYGSGGLTSNPLLGTLMDNGGKVQTISLATGSPAINAGLYLKKSGSTYYSSKDGSTWYTGFSGSGTTATPPADAVELTATDARGYARVGAPDLGAYEYGAAP